MVMQRSADLLRKPDGRGASRLCMVCGSQQ